MVHSRQLPIAHKEEDGTGATAARCRQQTKRDFKKEKLWRNGRMFVCVEPPWSPGAAPGAAASSPRHVRGGFPVQGVREAELGNDSELVLGLPGEPRRLLELKHGAVRLANHGRVQPPRFPTQSLRSQKSRPALFGLTLKRGGGRPLTIFGNCCVISGE